MVMATRTERGYSKKAADLLVGHFRSTGYPVRVGGDEFAVLPMDAETEEQLMVASKIATINGILTHPDDGMPVVLLSAGGVFPTMGLPKVFIVVQIPR